MTTQLWAVLLSLGGTFVGAFGPIFLKRGSVHLNRESLKSISGFIRSTIGNKSLVLGIGAYGVGLVVYTICLSAADVSVLYPIGALAYLWVAIFSKFMLHERITRLKMLGISLILIGALFVGLGS